MPPRRAGPRRQPSSRPTFAPSAASSTRGGPRLRRRLRRRLEQLRPGRQRAAASSLAASAPPASRLATEFQVNTLHHGPQAYPAVALASDGNFVVVWSSNAQDGSAFGVFARRFNSAGAAQATEFQVNTYTLGSQAGTNNPSGNGGPEVASDDSGGFVIVWQSFGQDGSAAGVFGRRFDAAGAPLAQEFQANSYTSSAQSYAAVDLDADGDFVVTWQSYAQDGNNAGSSLAASRRRERPWPPSSRSTCAPSPHSAIPAWASTTTGTSSSPGRATARTEPPMASSRAASPRAGRRWAASSRSTRTRPARSASPASRSTATATSSSRWESFDQDGSASGVFAQRFNSLGQRIERGVPGQHLHRAESVRHLRLRHRSRPARHRHERQRRLRRRLAQLWQDGAPGGVFAQRFDNIAVLDVDGNGATAPLTDGLLVLRFLFGFTGSTLTAGAVDLAGCQRCDAATIQAYLQTLI